MDNAKRFKNSALRNESYKGGAFVKEEDYNALLAEQPTALGGEPEIAGYFYAGERRGDQFDKLCLTSYYQKPGAAEYEYIQPEALIKQSDHRAHVAQLKAEIERLKEESFEGLYNAAIDERDQLKARYDELEGLLRDIRQSCELSQQRDAQIDAVLSKTA